MLTKKHKGSSNLISTENEFKTLLQIHNETKYAMAQRYSNIKPKLLDNLFTILSSQALLYDQIIRKGLQQADSLLKQNQLGKLIQTTRNTFEKNIQDYLSLFGTHFSAPLKQSKQDTFTLNNVLKNNIKVSSSNESLTAADSDSMITRIKRKQKVVKPIHVKTRSVCVSTHDLVFEEQPKKEFIMKSKSRKNSKVSIPHFNVTETETKENTNNIKKNFKRHNTLGLTHPSFSCIPSRAQSFINYQGMNTLSSMTDQDNSPRKNAKGVKYRNYEELDLVGVKHIGANPSLKSKTLMEKYQNIINGFTESLNNEKDDIDLNKKPQPKHRKTGSTDGIFSKISLSLNQKTLKRQNTIDNSVNNSLCNKGEYTTYNTICNTINDPIPEIKEHNDNSNLRSSFKNSPRKSKTLKPNFPNGSESNNNTTELRSSIEKEKKHTISIFKK